MNVLYVNHTGAISGAEHSLLSLAEHLPAEWRATVGSPAGALVEAARDRGIPTTALGGLEASLSTSPRQLPGVSVAIVRAALSIRAAARATGADVVHANSIRAGILAVVASRLGAPPNVVHLRDTLPPGRKTQVTLRAIASGANAVIANSDYTGRAFRSLAPRGTRAVTIHNPVDLSRFDAARVDRAHARRSLGLPAEALAVGVVGQLTPWKGQDIAVEAVAAAHAAGADVRLFVVGSAKFVAPTTRYDNLAHERRLHALVAEHGLGDRVAFLGERPDVPALMRAFDVLLVPSREEPFGRVVVEGMAMGAAVVATRIGGPAEIVTDEVDGLLLDPADVDAWAGAIVRLASDASLRGRLREAGLSRARTFGADRHVAAVLDVYASVL